MRLLLRIVLAVAVLGFTALAQAQVVTATNGILTVSMNSTTGQFTITTGASHPQANQQVLFPIGTSYITLRDVTASEVWTNDGAPSGNIGAGFTSHSMNSAPASSATTNISGGFRTTYTLPNWVVVQDVVIVGSTLSDTSVRQTVTVTNTSGVPRQYGVRYMWDWDIAGHDDSVFRTRNPDGSFTSTFVAFQPPAFQAFEEQAPSGALFSIFGTVQGGSLSPAPTPPDRLGYVSWSDSVGSPWDFPISGSNDDSATIHYWGFTAPLTLAAGASNSFVEYISTVASAVGIGPSVTLAVPTMNEWMLIAMALLIAGAAMYGLRRR
jgi:hypothetical protein